MQQAPAEDSPKRDVGVKSIVVLYLGFFGLWCAGLALGEAWTGPDQPLLWGMPLWFQIGCVFSFIAVAVALVFCVRRYFK